MGPLSYADIEQKDVNSYLAGKHARLLLFRLKASGWEPTEDEFKDTWAYYLSGVQYGTSCTLLPALIAR